MEIRKDQDASSCAAAADWGVSSTDYGAAEGRVLKQVRTFESVNYTAERRYDSAGRLLGITYPDGDAVGTPGSPVTYDAAGRPAAIPGILTSVSYDASGMPLTQANGNGTITNRAYSPQRGFMTGIQTVMGGTTIQDFAYEPDAAGMLSTVTSPFTNETWTYAYDDLHRMTSAANQSTPAESQDFTYDVLGRMTYNSKVGTYSYPTAGSARPHAPSTAGSNSYSYDANGNLYSGAGRSIAWDAENRISQVSMGSTTTSFTYDGGGERLKKTTGTSTSLYPMGDDYEVTDGVITKYVSVSGVGVVAKRVGSVTYWMHTDRPGSIGAITDAAGALVQRKTYRPYGGKLTDSTAHVESRGWIDQRQDETGLTYLHARYYDAQIGVFLRPDPLDPTGLGVGTNRYGYAFGNPVNGKDPSGLACFVAREGWFTGMPHEYEWTGDCSISGNQRFWDAFNQLKLAAIEAAKRNELRQGRGDCLPGKVCELPPETPAKEDPGAVATCGQPGQPPCLPPVRRSPKGGTGGDGGGQEGSDGDPNVTGVPPGPDSEWENWGDCRTSSREFCVYPHKPPPGDFHSCFDSCMARLNPAEVVIPAALVGVKDLLDEVWSPAGKVAVGILAITAATCTSTCALVPSGTFE